MGIPFSVLVSEAEEVITKTDPPAVVEELALLKAREVAKRVGPDTIVIGADTIVSIDGEILQKPKDEADAFQMLSKLSGQKHQVYTGVALIEVTPDQPMVSVFCEKTEVTMYPMTKAEIERYIATKEPLDKAGAYGIQGRAAAFVKEISGDYNNVVGLPVARLYQELRINLQIV